MMCDGFLLDSTSQGAPGVDYVKWMRPVLAGDIADGKEHHRRKAALEIEAAYRLRHRPPRSRQPAQRTGLRIAEHRHVPSAPSGGGMSAGFNRSSVSAKRSAATISRRKRSSALPANTIPSRFILMRRPPAEPFRRAMCIGLAYDCHLDGAQCPHARDGGRGRRRIRALPGFEGLKWLRPVYVGDTISYSANDQRNPSRSSRPGRIGDGHARGRPQPERRQGRRMRLRRAGQVDAGLKAVAGS